MKGVERGRDSTGGYAMAGCCVGEYGLVDDVHDLSKGGRRAAANGARAWRQSICLTGTVAGPPMTCWQDSTSGSPTGRTVRGEFQEYSSCAVSGVTARLTHGLPGQADRTGRRKHPKS